MSKKTIQYLDEIFETPIQEEMVLIATKGNYKRIYERIRTYEALQKIIDYRTADGWEVKRIK